MRLRYVLIVALLLLGACGKEAPYIASPTSEAITPYPFDTTPTPEESASPTPTATPEATATASAEPTAPATLAACRTLPKNAAPSSLKVTAELRSPQVRQGDTFKALVVLENTGDQRVVYGDQLQERGVAQGEGLIGGFDDRNPKPASAGKQTVLRPGEQAQFPIVEIDTRACKPSGDQRALLPQGMYEFATYFALYEAGGEKIEGWAVVRAPVEIKR